MTESVQKHLILYVKKKNIMNKILNFSIALNSSEIFRQNRKIIKDYILHKIQ